MAKVAIIVGLPGSGKTHLAISKYVPQGYILVDDPVVRPELDPALNYVICDPWLCRTSLRDLVVARILKEGFSVEIVYFENNPEKCINNLDHRCDGRNIKSLHLFKYEIPSNITPLTIWQKDGKQRSEQLQVPVRTEKAFAGGTT